MKRHQTKLTGRALLAAAMTLCGCDEWLATHRDDSPAPRLASGEVTERPTRPEPTIPTRAERSNSSPTPSANLKAPVPPPSIPLAPVAANPAPAPQPAPQPPTAPHPAPMAMPGILQPPANGTPPPVRPFPAAPRFPAAPQPTVAPPIAAPAAAAAAGHGPTTETRAPPGPRPLMPHMNPMRIARPPPAQP